MVLINKERYKGCMICVEFCPLNILAMSDNFNSEGYHFSYFGRFLADEEKCSVCALCGMYCPDFSAPSETEPVNLKAFYKGFKYGIRESTLN